MAAKILVVDDEPHLENLIRQKFRRQLRNQELSFSFARDGVEALDMLQEFAGFDLLLTDLNMPNIDGLTLLEHLPNYNPILKAIVITAYGDIANIRIAMHRDAYDFVTKPIDFEDLQLTMRRALDHVQKYLQYVARLTDAAAEVEQWVFAPSNLNDIAQDIGELGRLARIFQRMAQEVQQRELWLRQEVKELRIRIDQTRQARQVAEVTESEYFRQLQLEARSLRARASQCRAGRADP